MDCFVDLQYQAVSCLFWNCYFPSCGGQLAFLTFIIPFIYCLLFSSFHFFCFMFIWGGGGSGSCRSIKHTFSVKMLWFCGAPIHGLILDSFHEPCNAPLPLPGDTRQLLGAVWFALYFNFYVFNYCFYFCPLEVNSPFLYILQL